MTDILHLNFTIEASSPCLDILQPWLETWGTRVSVSKVTYFLDKTVLTAVTVNRGLYVSTWSNYEYRYTTIYCSDLDYILKLTINEVVQIEFFYVSPWKTRIKCFICLALFLQRFVFFALPTYKFADFFYFGNTWVKDIVCSTLSNSILWSVYLLKRLIHLCW